MTEEQKINEIAYVENELHRAAQAYFIAQELPPWQAELSAEAIVRRCKQMWGNLKREE